MTIDSIDGVGGADRPRNRWQALQNTQPLPSAEMPPPLPTIPQSPLVELLQLISQILQQILGSPTPADDPQNQPGGNTGVGDPGPQSPGVDPLVPGAGAGGGGGGDPVVPGGPTGPGGPPPATGPAPKGGPAKIDLSHFDALQLPTGSPGQVDQVPNAKLNDYNGPDFKRNSDGSASFIVPEGGGVHTMNSRFPRSELSERGSWHMNDGTATLRGTLSIDKLPPNGDVVIGQIHQHDAANGKPRPPVELHYDKGKIVASAMDSNSTGAGRHDVVIADGVKPGEKFSYNMSLAPGGKLTVSAAGHSKVLQLDPSFGGSNMYFRAGNYSQHPTGGSQVTFHGLDISHQ